MSFSVPDCWIDCSTWLYCTSCCVYWLLSIGGIEVKPQHRLGRDMTLDALVRDFDAVFLGLGLAGVNALGLGAEAEAASRAAVDFIAELRQAESPASVPVGRRVLVLGGGMTAVDAAVQSRLLGAEEVSIVYRRGPEAMPASGHEQRWAQHHGVTLRHWAAPRQLLLTDGRVSGTRINVQTQGASVTLRGKVETMDAKDAATQIARGIDGVREVKNELAIVPASKRKLVDAKDDAIVAEVDKRLKADQMLKTAKITVRSDAGQVTLSGQAPGLMASARASEVADEVDGVRTVKNELALK